MTSLLIAATLTCYFTEPFLQVKIDTTKELATIFEYGEKSLEFPIQNLEPGDKVSTADFGPYTLVFTEDGQGSDGMSDVIYPYSAVLKQNGKNDLHGGCAQE